MKNRIFLVSGILTLFAITPTFVCLSAPKMLLMGAVQFPATIKKTPHIRIYYQGTKIICESDNEAKKLLFSIAKDRHLKSFYLLITQDFQFESEKIESNTIKYLKVNPNQNYKLYRLTLERDHSSSSTKGALSRQIAKKELPKFKWHIENKCVDPTTGRFPDNTIIVCCNPEFVEELHGGNHVELPKIIIKKDVLSIAGSEEQLHDDATALILASMDYNALHTQVKQMIKHDYETKVVALMNQ